MSSGQLSVVSSRIVVSSPAPSSRSHARIPRRLSTSSSLGGRLARIAPARAWALALFPVAALILLIAPVEFLELLGRDATLTGRTDIWVILARQVADAPWTGYGYRAFWTVENGPVFWVRQGTSWPVPTAHNGWIETALALGIPGVALMATVFLTALGRALGRLFSGPETYWALGFIAMLGLVSISESNLMQQNSLSWVLFVATAAKLQERRSR